MTKWADYCISAVRYDKDEEHIDQVKVCEDKGESLGPEEQITRATVVSRIENGYSFVTVRMGSNEKWQKGADVGIVTVDGNKYIRTDANKTKADNLGSLPKF